jgi:4-hydroxybenzoate polyprenyltransferase
LTAPSPAASVTPRHARATWLDLLRISVPGFWLIYATPYVFAFLAAGEFRAAPFAAGLLVVWACVACIAILNEVTDRVEDRVNQPVHAARAEAFGYDRLLAVVRVLVGVGALVLVAVTVLAGPLLGLVCAVGGGVGLLYSVGPRFKRRGASPSS